MRTFTTTAESDGFPESAYQTPIELLNSKCGGLRELRNAIASKLATEGRGFRILSCDEKTAIIEFCLAILSDDKIEEYHFLNLENYHATVYVMPSGHYELVHYFL